MKDLQKAGGSGAYLNHPAMLQTLYTLKSPPAAAFALSLIWLSYESSKAVRLYELMLR